MEEVKRLHVIPISESNPEVVVTLGQTVHIHGKEPFTAIVRDPEGKTPVDQIQIDPLPVQLHKCESTTFFRWDGWIFRV